MTEIKRSSGVLLSVSSLPGKYGIGTFGKEAKKWIDLLSECGFTYWQVLPFTPVGDGNSPYSSGSAFAGNIAYIDPESLDASSPVYEGSVYSADYDFAVASRMKAIAEAASKIDEKVRKDVLKFGKSNPQIADYAYFMVLKEKFGLKPWYQWDDEYKDYKKAVKHKAEYENEIFIHLYSQYLFFTQWSEIKEYANSKDVKIFGDMPIYVSLDSSDVWSNRELFLLDKECSPEKVAGVPPDYFSEDGQLWGNPLYNWTKMEKKGFKWWINRVQSALKIYDLLRIDHFRAFASYWAVPAGAETAREGEWEDGPGMKLFSALKEALGELPIVAEDLGVFGDDVVQLLEGTGFPGMNVIQFGFSPDGDSAHLPHNYKTNSVAYTGTHDNSTLLGWLFEAEEEERQFALEYCSCADKRWDIGGHYAPACRAIIECVWRSPSVIAIMPFQDLCGFGNDTRMNVPGTPLGNWSFRTASEAMDGIDKEYCKKINKIFKR